jgi:hypothetical protein
VAREIRIHRPFNVAFAPIDDLVGAAHIKAVLTPDNGGGQPVEVPLSGLSFTGRDGDIDIFVMSDEERQITIQQLTGGIVLPG